MPSGLQSKDSRKAHILDRKAFIFFELISLFFNELFEYYLNDASDKIPNFADGRFGVHQ